MRFAPCIFCGSVTAFEHRDPVCGTCELMVGNSEERERFDREFELDQERRYLEDLQRSMQEEDEDWESVADPVEAEQLEEEFRQQMHEDDQRLYRNRLGGDPNNVLFRRIYMDHNSEDGEDEYEEERETEEELYENDQDDFDFDMSYQDNIQAIREGLLNRRIELAMDRAAIVQRLLRIFITQDGLPDDASQAKGASESDIATLKTRTADIDDPEGNIECAICTEKFEKLELTQLPCNHEYHSECIHHWLKLNTSCPMCRQSIIISAEQEQQSPVIQPQQEQEPDIIIIRRRETADMIRQNNSSISYMDDVD